MSQRTRGLLALAGLVVVLVLLLWSGGNGPEFGGNDDAGSRPVATATGSDDLTTVAVDSLPRQAAETLRLVDAGGPFPYERDGVVFRNAERVLPDQPRGYYREYTVPTPGSSDRGARRIVVGSGGEVYYTEDHYRSFVRVEAG